MAARSFSVASLGCGNLWDRRSTTESQQMWWVKSIWEVESNSSIRAIKYRSNHAKQFETKVLKAYNQFQLFFMVSTLIE
jgi:hypothetical protein